LRGATGWRVRASRYTKSRNRLDCQSSATETSGTMSNLDKNCAICLERLITDASSTRIDELVIGCTSHHTYHSECLNNWIISQRAKNLSPNCPNCREELTPDRCAKVERIFARVEKRWQKDHACREKLIMYFNLVTMNVPARVRARSWVLIIWGSVLKYIIMCVCLTLFGLGFKILDHPRFTDVMPPVSVGIATTNYLFLGVQMSLGYIYSNWKDFNLVEKVFCGSLLPGLIILLFMCMVYLWVIFTNSTWEDYSNFCTNPDSIYYTCPPR